MFARVPCACACMPVHSSIPTIPSWLRFDFLLFVLISTAATAVCRCCGPAVHHMRGLGAGFIAVTAVTTLDTALSFSPICSGQSKMSTAVPLEGEVRTRTHINSVGQRWNGRFL